MRRIILWSLSTVAVLVLLFSYRTSTSGPSAVASDTVVATGAPEASTTTSQTFTGSAAQTRWGPVQVRITVADGRITAVTVPEYPTENHKDQQINAYAVPVLVQETLDAQSADIDMVSGATVTSEGYVESLQSALDQAGL